MSILSAAVLLALNCNPVSKGGPGVHIADFNGFEKRLNDLYDAGIYDHKTNVMRVDVFDYTVDPHHPESASYYGLNYRLKAIQHFEQTHNGVRVKMLIRCTRTRGDQYDRIPIDPDEQRWWGEFVAGKAKLVDGPIAGWNEHSLKWFSDRTDAESYDRPERQAACTHQLILQLKSAGLSTKVLCPSIHSLKDGRSGYAITYAKRFFSALPKEDYPYVAPDAHLYYGAYVPADQSNWRDDVPDDLSRWLNYLSTLGFQPSDCYISEFGSATYDHNRGPTSGEAANRTELIYRAILNAGIPAEHTYVWWGQGAMEIFASDGTKTSYGEKVRKLIKGD